MRRFSLSAALASLGLMCCLLAQAQPAAPASASATKLRELPTEARVWKGDFDGMLERRHIRVLVPYSRTLFYNDKGANVASRPKTRATSSST